MPNINNTTDTEISKDIKDAAKQCLEDEGFRSKLEHLASLAGIGQDKSIIKCVNYKVVEKYGLYSDSISLPSKIDTDRMKTRHGIESLASEATSVTEIAPPLPTDIKRQTTERAK